MDRYRSVMDILGWTLQLLLNSAFVQTVLEITEGRETNSSSSHLIDWRDLQSMVSSSARSSMVLARSAELQGHLQDGWQWARRELHSQFTSHTQLPNGTQNQPMCRRCHQAPCRRSLQGEGGDLQHPQNSTHAFPNWITIAPLEGGGRLDYTIQTTKKLKAFIYKTSKILLQRKFIKSLAAC